MKTKLFFPALLSISIFSFAQTPTNMLSTNPTAEQIMLGNYNPNIYKPTTVINMHDAIANGLRNDISTDSLKSYLEKLGTFYNRNTYSDTVSNTIGIGAARRWVYAMFQKFSSDNENRLIPSFLQFDMPSNAYCGAGQFRNIFAVLPGLDTSLKDILIIEGHIDSRCENNCDINCLANGIEDNGSGTALVMELARTMSKYAFPRTIVFIVTIGEEQGLYGATAFALYAKNKNIAIRAVQNNDIDGGIMCGKTASPPTDCTAEGQIDSTHYRIFSYGSYTSLNKGYARFIKLEYIEELMANETVPMTINIMSPEDRTGRGGDHIPFRQQGYTAVRLTSAHEHGDASNDAGYTDRQHTTKDILGMDTNSDSVIDSFFVDFNYLKRNTLINGNALAMAAIGPLTPTFNLLNDTTDGLTVQITSQTQYNRYKVSVRRNAADYDLDLVFEFKDSLNFIVPKIKKDSTYYVSVASIDSNGVESLFTAEQYKKALGNSSDTTYTVLENFISPENNLLLSAKPNPSKDFTTFTVKVNKPFNYPNPYILVTDILGKEVARLDITLNKQINEVNFTHHNLPSGIYNYSLNIGGKFWLNSNRFIISK